MKIRTGDQVVVIAGNDKGRTGEVKAVLRAAGRVLVEGVNVRTKNLKPTQQRPQGEQVQREVPIHISNVMLIDPETGERTRRRPAKG
jgi:large subunit ribosomal protein L24